MTDRLAEYWNAFIRGCKELFHGSGNTSTGRKTAPEKKVRDPKPRPQASDSRPGWWHRQNAEYFRDNCPNYIQWIFPQIYDLEKALGRTLEHFFQSHGLFIVAAQFPEVHIHFIAVKIYGLRPEWNVHGLDLRQALLDELRRAMVNYAETEKRYALSGIINAVILNAWWVKDSLYLEIPASVFSIQYPELARILASPAYWNFRQALTNSDRF